MASPQHSAAWQLGEGRPYQQSGLRARPPRERVHASTTSGMQLIHPSVSHTFLRYLKIPHANCVSKCNDLLALLDSVMALI